MAPARAPDPREETAPLLLLANSDQSFRDTIEAVLAGAGYRVVTADSGPGALDRARWYRPDGILLDITFRPQFPDAYAVCQALRADPAISPATPIILTTPGPVLRAQQIEALRSGAWELRGHPLDTEELSLRLAAYVRGKRELDRLRNAGLVDPASGLYNASGVERRAEELAALTQRHNLTLACAVFVGVGPEENDRLDRLAVAFRQAARRSDAVGRLAPAEFAVFAPATDAAGAGRLVRRMSARVAHALGTEAVSLRAGVSAGGGEAQSAATLLARAREALGRDSPAL